MNNQEIPSNIKETPDQKILNKVMKEWAAGAGQGEVNSTILKLINKLTLAYGDKVSIEGICRALDDLSENSLLIKGDIIKEQEKTKS